MKAIKMKQGGNPQEIKDVVEAVNARLELYQDNFQIDPWDELNQLCVYGPEKYFEEESWGIGSNYEDGSSSTFFINGKWYYRDPWEGTDRPVPGGREEVIANWCCYFTA